MRVPKSTHWLCHPCSSLALPTIQDPRKAILCPQPYLSLDSSETPSPPCSPFPSPTPAVPWQGKENEAGSSGILPGPPWPGMTFLLHSCFQKKDFVPWSSCVSRDDRYLPPGDLDMELFLRLKEGRSLALPGSFMLTHSQPSATLLGLAFPSSLHCSGKLQRTWCTCNTNV